VTFSANKKKKKKIDLATGVAAIHPNNQGERDPATLSGHFCLSGEQKKKKKINLATGVTAIHPNGQGERDPATPSHESPSSATLGHHLRRLFYQIQPKKSFLMPQNRF
jgi:hypothetical protein